MSVPKILNPSEIIYHNLKMKETDRSSCVAYLKALNDWAIGSGALGYLQVDWSKERDEEFKVTGTETRDMDYNSSNKNIISMILMNTIHPEVFEAVRDMVNQGKFKAALREVARAHNCLTRMKLMNHTECFKAIVNLGKREEVTAHKVRDAIVKTNNVIDFTGITEEAVKDIKLRSMKAMVSALTDIYPELGDNWSNLEKWNEEDLYYKVCSSNVENVLRKSSTETIALTSSNTTNVGQKRKIDDEKEVTEEEIMYNKNERKINCRKCGGNHFTSNCPRIYRQYSYTRPYKSYYKNRNSKYLQKKKKIEDKKEEETNDDTEYSEEEDDDENKSSKKKNLNRKVNIKSKSKKQY